MKLAVIVTGILLAQMAFAGADPATPWAPKEGPQEYQPPVSRDRPVPDGFILSAPCQEWVKLSKSLAVRKPHLDEQRTNWDNLDESERVSYNRANFQYEVDSNSKTSIDYWVKGYLSALSTTGHSVSVNIKTRDNIEDAIYAICEKSPEKTVGDVTANYIDQLITPSRHRENKMPVSGSGPVAD